jgi:hypothetical protein
MRSPRWWAGIAAAGCVVAGAVLLGQPTASASPTESSPTTTAAVSEAGQRVPTQGPVGPTPRAKEKLKVNVIQGLIEGAPIFQGDFADPFVVRLPMTRTRVTHVTNVASRGQ